MVVVAQPGDSLSSLATQYLGSPADAWQIAELNATSDLRPGQDVIIPLRARNPGGVSDNGYQTVPILCYHRFGAIPSKLTLTASTFEAQMDYLARNGYRVIALRQMLGFLAGNEPLPPKSVVITIDDGYRSTYEIAYPILKKYRFPATLFLYTDFAGARDAVSWPQMQEMQRSGLIDIQSHSNAHSNLAVRTRSESQSQYEGRVRREVEVPKRRLAEYLGAEPFAFAYPYGDVNASVIEQMARENEKLGLTVTPGGNAFFAPPFMLRRTMVFGHDDLNDFRSKVQVFTPLRGS